MQYDLIILGGGPAGAVAAWLAARDGLRVALVDPDRTAARIEGLSPRLAIWLTGSGLLSPGELGAISVPRQSRWAEAAFDGNHELIVERARLDSLMRQRAEAVGARWLRDTALPEPGGARLASGERLIAPLVFDARGRRAGGDGRRGPPTLAISCLLQTLVAPPSTMIKPVAEGWLWRADCGDGRAWVQFTTDAADPAGRPPLERLDASLIAAGHPGAKPLDILLVREAAPVLPVVLTDLASIPIGDALAAMDPLSGHGMFWAVSSALAATAVRRTLAQTPDATGLALRFLNQRASDVYLRQARLGRDFIIAMSSMAHHPFWSARRSFPDSLPLTPAGNLPRIARRVVVENDCLVERDVLLTRETPGGVGWLGGQSAAEMYHAQMAGTSPEKMRSRFGPAGSGFGVWLANQMGDGMQA